MPKDYKNIKKQTEQPSSIGSKLLPLFTGICLGIFISFFVFLYVKDTNQNNSPIESPPPSAEKEKEKPKIQSPPEPKFDFYKILPNREVNISEWIAEDQEEDKPSVNETYLYVLQVGSFKEYKAADQTKAQLALIGITADIQRVFLNGQDSRHRVRVGPFADRTELSKIEKRLRDNNLEFIQLRLKLEELETNQ